MTHLQVRRFHKDELQPEASGEDACQVMLVITDNPIMFRLFFEPMAGELGMASRLLTYGELETRGRAAISLSTGLVVIDLSSNANIAVGSFDPLVDLAERYPVVAFVNAVCREKLLRLSLAGVLSVVESSVHPEAVKLILQMALLGQPYTPSTIDLPQHRAKTEDLAVDLRAPFAQQRQPTSTEMAVLSLLAEGHSNKEIARELQRSETTVKMHMSRLMKKFGVNNRVKLSSIAQRLRAQQPQPRMVG